MKIVFEDGDDITPLWIELVRLREMVERRKQEAGQSYNIGFQDGKSHACDAAREILEKTLPTNQAIDLLGEIVQLARRNAGA